MAYYFETMTATTNVSPALDPTTELFTFLSTYLQDWATKLGSTYATFEAGHPDWTTTTSLTSTTCPIKISLVGAPGIAGNDPDGENMGYQFSMHHGAYSYRYRGHTSGSNYNGTGDNRDSETNNSQSVISLYSSSAYSSPSTSAVWYSDTPGARYFAYRLLDRDGYSCIITEMNNVDHVPNIENYGWAYFSGLVNNPLCRGESSASANNLNPWVSRSNIYDYRPENSFANSRWLTKNLPAWNVAGGWMGHAGDIILRSAFAGVPFSAINYSGSQYVAIDNHLWVKTS